MSEAQAAAEELFRLFGDEDPAPVALHRPDGSSPIFLTSDHSGRLMPASLSKLGLPDGELERHIAWDIGVDAVARGISGALDATLVAQLYSRLIIDCNRDPRVASSIAELSELTEVPGNRGLSDAHRRLRHDLIFRPYHDAIAAALDRRQHAGRETVLVAMHSFTPVYRGVARPWHAAVLYNRDPRLSHIVRDLLVAEGLTVGDNEPYSVSDETDYTIPVHAERRGLPHVAIEIRQDLIAEAPGQREWAERLSRLLPQACRLYRKSFG